MSAALAHRGPDGRGEWEDPDHGVHLAVRRLAILDREMGSQPMRSPDRSLVVALQRRDLQPRRAAARAGDPPAHRSEPDHSDTEVLLNAYRQWGPELTNHLNGMWAFAIYDAPRHRLFLSRDRFGQKPLFHSFQNGTFAFASELTSLLQHQAVRASVSALSVQKVLRVWVHPCAALAIRAGVQDPRRLQSGRRHSNAGAADHALLGLRPGSSGAAPMTVRSRAESSEQLRFLLHQAVRRQMRSDVPVGVFLSGGLDSSTIAHFAATEVPKLETFSIGFDRRGVRRVGAGASRVVTPRHSPHTQDTDER